MAAMAVVGCLALGGCQQVRQALAGTSDSELMAAVSLTEHDAADDAVFQPYEGGTEVAGEVSLDLCFGQFPSEELRIGRLQVGIGSLSDRSWVSSEAILYSTPQEADQAMAELAEARTGCPDGPVPAPRPDREPLQWRFDDAPDAAWPATPDGVARQAYAFTATDPAGDTWSSTATYLQRGRMILALYSTPPDGPASTIRNAPGPARFVEVMTNRLMSLPADALRRGDPSLRAPADGLSA